MTTPDLQALADRTDTGTDAPDTSRALVVFNLSDAPRSGVAVFRASMAWPVGVPLPPVAVRDGAGALVSASVRDLAEAPDAKGRADRRRLSFALCFTVPAIPARAWCTYIASYAEAASPPLDDLGEDFMETSGLAGVETTRHGGDLPPSGPL